MQDSVQNLAFLAYKTEKTTQNKSFADETCKNTL